MLEMFRLFEDLLCSFADVQQEAFLPAPALQVGELSPVLVLFAVGHNQPHNGCVVSELDSNVSDGEPQSWVYTPSTAEGSAHTLGGASGVEGKGR